MARRFRTLREWRAIFAKLREAGLLTPDASSGRPPRYRELPVERGERVGGYAKTGRSPERAALFGETAITLPPVRRVLERALGGRLYDLRLNTNDVDNRPIDFIVGPWAVEVKSHHYSNASFEAKVKVGSGSFERKLRYVRDHAMRVRIDGPTLQSRYRLSEAEAANVLKGVTKLTTVNVVHNGLQADIYVHAGGERAKNASPATSRYFGTVNVKTGAFQTSHRLVQDVHRVRAGTKRRVRRVRVVDERGA